jgi:hypothetical protein
VNQKFTIFEIPPEAPEESEVMGQRKNFGFITKIWACIF